MKVLFVIFTLIFMNLSIKAYSEDLNFLCDRTQQIVDGVVKKISKKTHNYRYNNSRIEEKITGKWVSWCTEEHINAFNESQKNFKWVSADIKNEDTCIARINFSADSNYSHMISESIINVENITRSAESNLYDRDQNLVMNSEVIYNCSIISSNSSASTNEDISNVNAPSITIELLSYEQKTSSYDDKPYCTLSYSITNNSWGTLYGIRVKTEAFDDRDTKLDDYGLGGNVLNPFSGWFDDQKFIRVGDMKQVSNLEYGGKCKYMGAINVLEVKPSDCNIRMMPEDGSCFDILNLKSKIDHITFKKP